MTVIGPSPGGGRRSASCLEHRTYGSSCTQRAYGPYQAAWRAKRLSEAWSALSAIARRTLCPPGTTFRPRRTALRSLRGLQLHHLCRLRVHPGAGDGESAQECHLQREQVTRLPISVFETDSSVPELWRQLRSQCLEADGDCDVMAIPHNPNLGGGLMFPDPATEQEAIDRLEIEPLVELCSTRVPRSAALIAWQALASIPRMSCVTSSKYRPKPRHAGQCERQDVVDRGLPVDVASFHRRNMMRNVLKDGLALEQDSGLNPFRQGFIGSTDTHTATSGGAMEKNYVGHLGSRDATFRNLQDHFVSNPVV